MIAWTKRGIAHGIDGWLDDDLAFSAPWGLDLGTTTVPVLLMQGDLDKMVPFAHVDLLEAAMPKAEVRRLPGDGHLTLLDRVPEIHAWLLQAWNA
jgi:pimeloyl-ACP methyl ester carboxylesterase